LGPAVNTINVNEYENVALQLQKYAKILQING
jgi:hypothetical protein